MKLGCTQEFLESRLLVKDFKIVANSTIEDGGWNQTVCIQCSNGDTQQHQTIDYDNFKVIQTRNCKTSLVSKKYDIAVKIENYDGDNKDGVKITQNGFNDFFKSLDYELCGTAEKCELKSAGCSGSYVE